MRGWEGFLESPAHQQGRGCYVQGEGHGMWGTEACHLTFPLLGLEGGRHQGTWMPEENDGTKGTCASGSIRVG